MKPVRKVNVMYQWAMESGSERLRSRIKLNKCWIGVARNEYASLVTGKATKGLVPFCGYKLEEKLHGHLITCFSPDDALMKLMLSTKRKLRGVPGVELGCCVCKWEVERLPCQCFRVARYRTSLLTIKVTCPDGAEVVRHYDLCDKHHW